MMVGFCKQVNPKEHNENYTVYLWEQWFMYSKLVFGKQLKSENGMPFFHKMVLLFTVYKIHCRSIYQTVLGQMPLSLSRDKSH